MQDRFKFRFWITYFDDDINKTESVMQYSDNLDSEISGSYLFYNDDDVVIQQSTGLKDKNGNLIYEGDIVKAKNTKGKYSNFRVDFDNCWAYFGVSSFLAVSPLINVDTTEEFEIIGNIYENKELLEVSNG